MAYIYPPANGNGTHAYNYNNVVVNYDPLSPASSAEDNSAPNTPPQYYTSPPSPMVTHEQQQQQQQQAQLQHTSLPQPAQVQAHSPQQTQPRGPVAILPPITDIGSQIQVLQTAMHQQYDRLRNILKQQQQVLAHQLQISNPQVLWDLTTEEEQLYTAIEGQIKTLVALNQQVMLSPQDISKVRTMRVELYKQLKQLELYKEELRNVREGTVPAAPLASLVIIKQPFPQVIRKGAALSEDSLTVQLLTGAYNDLSSFRTYNEFGLTQVTATLLLDNGPAGNISFLEANTQTIDLATGVARFPLRFPNGTRKTVVHIKFGMPLGNGPSAPAVESEMSDPLIIITNECQWEGSLGTLIKKHAFGGKLEITWPLFANTLQHYFLVATRQDPSHPKRPLSEFDFSYLHQKFFGARAMITQTTFDKFWEWFGKIVHVVRFQRHICSLWQVGVIYGFLDRESVTNVLVSNRQPVGTFIIRFSERHAGQFDIVWVGTGSSGIEINHYLVKHDDIGAPRRTLPDFISVCPQFLYLLQLTVGQDGVPGFVPVQKDVVLQQFTHPRQDVAEEGYAPLT